MSFLARFKKKTSSDDDELDVPPIPPPQLKNIPQAPKKEQHPEKPIAAPIPAPKAMHSESYKIPDIRPQTFADIEPIPKFQETPKVQKPVVESKPEEKKQVIHPEPFIMIDTFKAINYDIDSIKTSLKSFEKNLLEVNWEEKEETSMYGKLKSNLNYVQQKLKYIDKVLFEG